jgi:hypothetical protein
VNSDSELVTICVVQGELNGELIKSRLEVEGVPSMLKFETYFNLNVGVFCPVNVLVPRKYEEVAKRVVKPMGPNLVSTIPTKNKWTFVILRLFSILFGGR